MVPAPITPTWLIAIGCSPEDREQNTFSGGKRL